MGWIRDLEPGKKLASDPVSGSFKSTGSRIRNSDLYLVLLLSLCR
jgi:hypothetical protein